MQAENDEMIKLASMRQIPEISTDRSDSDSNLQDMSNQYDSKFFNESQHSRGSEQRLPPTYDRSRFSKRLSTRKMDRFMRHAKLSPRQ